MKKIIDSINNTKIYQITNITTLDFASDLSRNFANHIYLKREDSSVINSFKIRGAYQKIISLTNTQKSCGVIASSAGNHAQGVALSAQKLNIKATIIMPLNTPQIKVLAVKNLGAKVILFGDVYDETYQFAKDLSHTENLTFIHPYNDLEVIAGQGTIAKELLKQLPNLDMVFMPVGGGGLISGIASFIKYYHPKIKIIGVEPDETPKLFKSLQTNKRIILDEIGRFADGVAIKQIGELPFELLKDKVDEVVLVSNDEMCAAIKDIYNDTRAIAEPSGALATAGVKKYITTHNIVDKNIVSIVSGGNINFDRLRYVAERAELGENNEAIFAATIDEKAGSFLRFCQSLNAHTITEFNYRFADSNKAHVFVGVSLKEGIKDKNTLFDKLKKEFTISDLSDNSIAKTHIRYMVGGKSSVENEVLYRFEFPERPNALLDFLTEISGHYNISLFHYRNHGSAYGRVLVGFQTNDLDNVEKIFDKIGYIYHNETANEAYQYFL